MNESLDPLRQRILKVAERLPVHVGGCFSCLDIIDQLYSGVLKEGDTFVLSKGHAALALYVVLEKQGVLTSNDIEEYCTRGGRLGTHTDLSVPGVVASTGSLGHGLGMALGIALADRTKQAYCLISDGELFEGSTWESFIQAPNFELENLHLLVDWNGAQSIDKQANSHPKFTAFGLETILEKLGWTWDSKNPWPKRPKFIIHQTPKGYGLEEAELNPVEWHYKCVTPSGKS